MLAGVAIGPFTPEIIGETEAIAELAEVGIIFLMFIGVQLSDVGERHLQERDEEVGW